ncbi:MAG: aminopeptidase P family N-terminal domain-containing protein [Bacillales bacterium]|jgi:Xaa-Pro aminopeptidase|nr:aminopeptidase P family N-terminal domain-containing protein [Bacillales bacterium]
MEDTKKNLNALFADLLSRKINYFLLFLSDPHLSEYVAEQYKYIRYLTGFTGSNATVIFSSKEKKGYFFTDGRYTVQAKKELPVNIELQPLEADYLSFLQNKVDSKSVVAIDTELVSLSKMKQLQNTIGTVCTLETRFNIMEKVWALKERPKLPNDNYYLIKDEEAGLSAKNKINNILNVVKSQGANSILISTLTDIAWITNVRGSDVAYTPVFYAYLFLSPEKNYLFTNLKKVPSNVEAYLKRNDIKLLDYQKFETTFTYERNHIILLDPNNTTFSAYKIVENKGKNRVLLAVNPSERMKAIKNNKEIELIRQAHIDDAVAMIKFSYWIKTDKKVKTEWEISLKLDELRKLNKSFLQPSFNSIVAFKEHGAMMHYAPSENDPEGRVNGDGLLLVDSGGQYKYGTTDITRTYAIGTLTSEEITHYTYVLRSLINLSTTKFLAGCSGQSLDVIARKPLWDLGLDYKSGTGHGVGFLNSVHEGPNRFMFKKPLNTQIDDTLVENMVTTIEPGIYLENQYGIRHENVTNVIKDLSNEQGQFYALETLTLVPFDLEAINPNLLNPSQKKFLNDYHKSIQTNKEITSQLSIEENTWLIKATRAI